MARSRRLGSWGRRSTSLVLLITTILGGLALTASLTASPASAAVEPVVTRSVTEGDSGYRYVKIEAAIPAEGDGQVLAYRVLTDGSFGNSKQKDDFTYENNDQERYPIAEGQDTFTVEVAIKGDRVYEPEEFFTIVVHRDGTTDPAVTTKVVIQDDDQDDEPTIQISSSNVPEGDSGTTNLTFELTRVGSPHFPSVVDWSLEPGLPSACSEQRFGNPTPGASATPGTDYQDVSDKVSFAPGETSKKVTVPIVGDLVKEPKEQLHLVLASVTNATIQTGCQGWAQIQDNDEIQGLQVYDAATVTEGNSGTKLVTFTVERRGVRSSPASVRWSTTDTQPSSELPASGGVLFLEGPVADSGPTTAGVDYTPVTTSTGLVSFAANQTSATLTVAVRGDTVPEPGSEKFYVTLSSPVGVAIVKASAGATIKDDDTGLVVDDKKIRESGPGVQEGFWPISIWRTGNINKWSWVNWDLANGSATALSDYVGDFGIEYFAPGEIRKDIRVKTRGDTTPEALEQFRIDLSEPGGAAIVKASGVIEIADDDGFSVNDAEVEETQSGTTQATATISLPAPAPNPVSVTWATINVNKNLPDGTATATRNVDYAYGKETVTFAPGETSKTATVTILGDYLNETTEAFAIYLYDPVGAPVTDDRGYVKIRNFAAGLSVGDTTLVEGNSGTSLMTFAVTRQGSLSGAVSATWGTATSAPYSERRDGGPLVPTAESAGGWDVPVGSAAAGTDYTTRSNQTVTFRPGEDTKTISVPVIGDTTVEPHESVKVVLSMPVGTSILDSEGIGTIVTDDSGISLKSDLGVPERQEGTRDLVLLVERTGAIDRTSTVNWTTTPGTAQANVDFTASSGTVTFLPDETFQTIAIPLIGDTQIEPHEWFGVQLSAPTNGVILDGTLTAYLTNDDGLSVSNAQVLEPATGTAQATFKISLTGPAPAPVTVKWATALYLGHEDVGVTVSSAGPADYTAVSIPKTVTFAPGEVSKDITVDVKADLVDEGLEGFRVQLSSPSGAPILDGESLGMITDNDTGFYVGDAKVVEGTGGTKDMVFTVTRRGQRLVAASVKVGTSDYASPTGGTGASCLGCSGIGNVRPPRAAAGEDYVVLAPLTVSFPAGVMEQTVTVRIVTDALYEDEEQLYLNILSATGAGLTIRDGQGSGVIMDDDPYQELRVS